MKGAGGQSICPHCGYDLQQDAPVEFGRLSYDPRIGVMLDGKRLAMPPQCHQLLGTLMRMPGKTASKGMLAERMGYEGDGNLVDTRIAHARVALRDAGLPNLIVTVWRTGVYFDPAPLPSAQHGAALECQ